MPRFSLPLILVFLLNNFCLEAQSVDQKCSAYALLSEQLDSARLLVERNPVAALETADVLLPQAARNAWPDLVAASQYVKGKASWYLGRYAESKTAYTNALDLQIDLDDSIGMARSYLSLGQVATQIGNSDAAKILYSEAASISRRTQDQEGIILSLIGEAEWALGQNNVDTARQYCQTIIPLAESLGDSAILASAYALMALVETQSEHYEAAQIRFDQALNYLNGLPEIYLTCRVSLAAHRSALLRKAGATEDMARSIEDLVAQAHSQRWQALEESGYALLADLFREIPDPLNESRCLREFIRIHRLVQHETQMLVSTKADLEQMVESIRELRRLRSFSQQQNRKADLWKAYSTALLVLLLCLFLLGFALYSRYLSVKTDRNILKSRKEEAEAKSNRLQEFTSTVSHDIKEPIRSVALFLELLKREQLLEEEGFMSELYVEAKKQVDDLDQFLKDLEDYFGLSGGRMEMESVHLGDILEKVQRRLRSRILETHAELDITPMPVIYSQPTLLLMIFQNLISNALKFCRQGVRPEVQIGAKLTRDQLSISIKDNGIGISRSYQSGIFHAFNRGNSQEYPGAGLGLAIVAKAVSILKGSISVHSDPEKSAGTIFLITLPLIAEPGSQPNEYISSESMS